MRHLPFLLSLLYLACLGASLPSPPALLPPLKSPSAPSALLPSPPHPSPASLPRGGASRFSRRRRREALRFAAVNAALYAALHRAIAAEPVRFVPASCWVVFALWSVRVSWVEEEGGKSSELTPTLLFMEEHFYAPATWPGLRKRPFCMFGSAFSHKRFGHIAANLGSLLVFAPHAVRIYGRKGFAHLYLLSVLASQLFVCLMSEWGPRHMRRSRGGESLGASGAISGVNVAVMLVMGLEKRRFGNYKFTVAGKAVEPILLLATHVLGDLTGLTGGGGIIGIANVLVRAKIGVKDDEDSDNNKKNIGFDSHVGGAAGGVVFWAISAALRHMQRHRRYR
jgi:membrane associated rhomboid family serine protease